MKVEMLSGTETLRRQDELASLVLDAVEHGASVGFAFPLVESDLGRYWQQVAGEVAAGGAELFVTLDERGRVVGTAQLLLEARSEGRHRAEVRKVMVKHALRGRGLGAALMSRLEHEAQLRGRSVLILDTSTGVSGASVFYRRLGYNFVGSIPNYAANPDGRLVPNAIFYKLLSPREGVTAGSRSPHVVAGR
jgi:acetyltransferase